MGNHFSENKADRRFELDVGGQTAFANIRREGGIMYIDYVFAPAELRGTGAAGELMKRVTEIAKDENLDIIPICGYAVSWLKRHQKN